MLNSPSQSHRTLHTIGFQKNYALATVLLFALEVCIALFVHDRIIRPYAGDFLATILLYCLVRSVVTAPAGVITAAVLAFSYAVEASQYFHLLAHLGWQKNKLARIVFGNHFEWSDLLAYTLGALLIFTIEQLKARRILRTPNGLVKADRLNN
ncbi:DUF2809 domain-containing protein [Hymenobacter sp. BT664]|uniref:DUF2809 domain-containing protein n=1 Tax=Hymenobacter montanus TaxID=2771359 RepID=A0A927BFJ6_9BACT|nr:DUF2809 domain-containing protein [Hymenobacter montanus]MBD2769003.1 DUF2809 domain-containing protein [Hymenobacter montanus]